MINFAAWAVVVVVLSTPGCLLAPAAGEGLAEGQACTSDLACAAGLACECGVCEEIGAVDDPVTCTANANDSCPDEASPCYAECGDFDSVIGEATCVFGRERCDEGSTFDECGPTVCWDDPEPGEVCVNGEYICENGRSQATDLCYTSDCFGPPGECVNNCNDGFVFDEQCLAGAYQCEVGIPIEECGNCVGEAPGCVLSCPEPPVATAFCTDGEWDCSFVQDAFPDDECGPVDAGPTDAGPDDAGAPTDAGPTDGGVDLDAGPTDAGVVDAGPADAGPADAGDADAGPPDAGPSTPPVALQFSSAPPSAVVDVCSPAVPFDVIDAAGDPTRVSDPTIVSVTEERTAVTIYSDPTCSNAATVVLVQPGTSSGVFYFMSTAALTFNVEISSSGLTPDSQTITVSN